MSRSVSPPLHPPVVRRAAVLAVALVDPEDREDRALLLLLQSILQSSRSCAGTEEMFIVQCSIVIFGCAFGETLLRNNCANRHRR